MSQKTQPKAALGKIVSIKDLQLNPANPRLAPREDGAPWDQKSMLEHFSSDDTVRELAKDIVEFGLNPTKKILVERVPNKNVYVVIEGNRRVSALRLLSSPELAADKKGVQFFKTLSATGAIPGSIECVDGLTKEEYDHWVELEHTKEHKGRGTVSWGTQEHSRFKLALHGKARHKASLDLLEMLVNSGSIDVATMKKVPVTTLDRILQDKYVRSRLDDTSKSAIAKQGAVVNRIVRDLAEGMTVNKVRSVDDRRDYIDRVFSDPSKSNAPMANKSGSSAKSAAASSAKRSKRLAWDRKYLIPSGFTIRSGSARLREVADELKRLDAENFTNSASVMFRVLLDIGLALYITKNKIAIDSLSYGGYELKKAVKAVCEHIIKSGGDAKKLNPIIAACSDKHSFLAVENFHGYVHSAYSFPSRKDLNRKWDAFSPLLEVILG